MEFSSVTTPGYFPVPPIIFSIRSGKIPGSPYRNTLAKQLKSRAVSGNRRALDSWVQRNSRLFSGSPELAAPEVPADPAGSGGLPQPGGAGEVDRDELRDAAFGHRHTEQPVDARHRDAVMGDH